MKFLLATTLSSLSFGFSTATEGPDSQCGKLTKCYLVNLESNGERNVFDADGLEIIPDGPATSFKPEESSKGWSIKCEGEGTVDYVKYTMDGGKVNTHYSAPFYINGDNNGQWINKLDSLSNKCAGDVKIAVTYYTWGGGDKFPCGSFKLKLQTPEKPPAFRRCHLCRRCKSMRFHTTGVFPNPFPGVPQLKVVQRGGRETVRTGLSPIRYRKGQDYVDAYWLEYPKKAKEVADGSVFMRATNGSCASKWRKCSVGSPIALDLDMSGAVEHITGEFDFDLSGNGIPEELTEWFAPTEGILVDSTYPGFDDGTLIGWHLYGDLGGMYDDGFDKLAMHDFNGDGMVSGEELDGIAIWTDANSNAVLDDGELSTLESHGVVSFSLSHDDDYISTATLEDGSEMVTQDLWFAR